MNMHRIDKILINIFGIVIVIIWVNYFIDGLVESLFISFLIFLAVRTIFIHILNRYRKLKNITVWEMSQIFAIMGAEEVCKHLINIVPNEFNPVIEQNCIIFTKDKNKILVLPLFKTVPVSTEEILKIWRFAKANEVNTIWVLARELYRKVIVLANSLEGEFIFFHAKKIHRFLLNHNALPKKNFAYKKVKNKISFSAALSDVFIKRRAKYFLFSGIVLAIMSFFAPFTVYYLVMATILFGLSITCLVLDRG